MALKKASLACTVCGSRNYSIKLSSTPRPKRLEVNKYCKHCSKYTIHKETRQEKVVKFIRDTFQVLKDTTWPTRKQSWIDFISVMEYTAFFVVIIYLCYKRFSTIVKYLLIFSLLAICQVGFYCKKQQLKGCIGYFYGIIGLERNRSPQAFLFRKGRTHGQF